MLGNHDAVQRSTRLGTGEKFYEETFGIPAQDFVVECGDLQVALVDSTDPTASPFPDWDVSKGSVGGEAAGVDSGALKPGQADELAARLDPKRRTLVVQHHELHPFPGFPPVKFALREEDAAAELDALEDHNLVGIVAGHTHRSAVLPVAARPGDKPTTQLEIPALKDWPHAYSVVGVTDDAVRSSSGRSPTATSCGICRSGCCRCSAASTSARGPICPRRVPGSARRSATCARGRRPAVPLSATRASSRRTRATSPRQPSVHQR